MRCSGANDRAAAETDEAAGSVVGVARPLTDKRSAAGWVTLLGGWRLALTQTTGFIS